MSKETPSLSCWHPHRCVIHWGCNPEGEGRGVSDLKTESERRRGERESARTMSTAQLPAQSAEIHSSAQKLTESRQNAAASTGKHRQTRQRHGIWPWNTNSREQQEGSKAIGCRNALIFSPDLNLLKGSLLSIWSDAVQGQSISQGGPSEVGK